MKACHLTLLVVTLLTGCSQQDPIDRLMAKLQKDAKTIWFTSYPFSPVSLPTNATPEQVISALSNRGDFQATNIVVVEIREVQTPEDVPHGKHHTAVLVNSSAGQKVVLIRPMNSDWYYRIYDTK